MSTHPIVAQMMPSGEQEPAILQRGRDVVVTAGAGTGKTRTLVARYLSLLAEGCPLRSIIAITFTRKAAREMRNRVREQVRDYLDGEDLSDQELVRWQRTYRDLDAARIDTIHSLCTEILRTHPAEARVDPRFEVLEENLSSVLLGRAIDEALAWAADDPLAVNLFPLLGEWDLRRVAQGLVSSRLETREAFDQSPPDLLAHWRQVLEERQEQALKRLLARPEWQQAQATLEDAVARDPNDLMEIQRQETLAALQARPPVLADRLAALSALAGINLRGGRQNAWPGGKEQLAEVKATLKSLRDLWAGEAVLKLSIGEHDQAVAEAMPALRALFDRMDNIYQRLKEERGVLDYDDLEDGALTLLRQNTAVCARWQREVQAILVDEFQDTNARQRDLVALLNGGQRLFIVGDAKQSIYRFRGADVTVFRQERQRIEEKGGRHFTLATSYRSHQDLLQGLNDLLQPILGETADPERPWAEPFAPLSPSRIQASPGFSAPHIELHLTVGQKSGGALERAADLLVARIVELAEAGIEISEGSSKRPLDLSDIAILCRASTSFGVYEDALERANVPFLTVAGRGFYGRPEIRDLLNVLKALADPSDDLALAGLLRSPAFALSDETLYSLCQKRDGQLPTHSLWDVLQDAAICLPPDQAQRAARAVNLVSSLLEQVGRTSVADVLKALLDQTDYRAALIQARQTRAARNVYKLLADAHQSRIVGVGEFLEYIDVLRDSSGREGEARATAEGAVQLMTVHAAKGLEFPVVIIGDVTRGIGRGGSLLVTLDLGPLLPLKDQNAKRTAAYELGRERAKDQEEAESDRLLYVAATRAREKLILSGCIDVDKASAVKKPGGWLGKLASANCLGLDAKSIAYDDNGTEALDVDLCAGQTTVACTIYEPGFAAGRELPVAVHRTASPVSIPPPLLATVVAQERLEDPKVTDQERTPPKRVWRVVPPVKEPRAPAWVIGSLVHEALAAWRFPEDVSTSSRSQGADFEHWARSRARGYGLTDPAQLRDAVRRSRTLLRRFQDHALFQEMDSAEQRLHEVPYSRLVDGQPESGILDALYQRDGAWTIVEFKTDEVRDEADFNRLLRQEDYVAQARRYLEAVGQLLATEQLLGERPRLVLCMMNFAGGVYLHPVD